jgi:hypothetical protein
MSGVAFLVLRVLLAGGGATYLLGCSTQTNAETLPKVDGALPSTTSGTASTATASSGAVTSTTAPVSSGVTVTASGGEPCPALAACCKTLPATLEPPCEQALEEVQAGSKSCTSEVAAYMAAGYCGSTSGSTGSSITGACASLDACCPSLQGTAAVACKTAVGDDNQGVCAAEVAHLMADGQCGATTTSQVSEQCAVLESCCGTLPVGDQAACGEVASAGDGVDCAMSLSTYKSAGFCASASATLSTASVSFTSIGSSSGVTGSSGTTIVTSESSFTADACESLQGCCDALPMSERATCQQIAGHEDTATCANLLSVYTADGYCTGSGTASTETVTATVSGSTVTGGASSVTTGSFASGSTVTGGGTSTATGSIASGGSSFTGGSGGSSGSGSTGPCGVLDGCCPFLPSNLELDCYDSVDEGNAANCSAELSSLQAQQYCM